MFCIIEKMPSVENYSAGMLDAIKVVGATEDVLGYLVNTDENVALKLLANSASVITSSDSLVRLIVCADFGLTTSEIFYVITKHFR